MSRSESLFRKAKELLCGGVNSPVRAMKPHPFFTSNAKGATLFDVDGNSYVDYCLGYGPLILGHANEEVACAVKEQIDKGSLYGTPTELESRYAEEIIRYVPNAEKVRIVNTGTGATMTAIRLARGFTGKNKIVKFEGAFHGAHDHVLVKAGSGAFGVSASEGIPDVRNTLVVEFNDIEALTGVVEKNRDIACIIIEPVVGNAGCILPEDDYLSEVRKLTQENDILLIFDEVITGFRLGMGGAQEYFGVDADLITLGKIAGGGFPIGVITGRREIMSHIAPEGRVYNAGTFNGNPVSVTAGLKTLEILRRGDVHLHVNRMGDLIRDTLGDIVADYHLSCTVQGLCSMFQLYFNPERVINYKTAIKSNTGLFLEYQGALLSNGVFVPPSQFECCFLSGAHSEEVVEDTLEKMGDVLKSM